eukprot:Blabericola_migrator_1__5697@NODE_2890_length_2234_cov_26_431472_g1814_i0_p2_GENE_NODE_2890_length_2234_cov_26_431472_g1814_i0NODE_2890_length_2234_cov_26_431472_g1814_i0_p2_ORF_typecomplete_len131_score15_99_NODE_2890_length_2234_cov_26_431472_g1814_i0201593
MRFALLALSLSAVFALRGEYNLPQPLSRKYGMSRPLSDERGNEVYGKRRHGVFSPLSEAEQDKLREADQEKFIQRKSPWKSFKRLFKRRGKMNISRGGSSAESDDQSGSRRGTMGGSGDSEDNNFNDSDS